MGKYVNGEYQPNKAGVFVVCLVLYLISSTFSQGPNIIHAYVTLCLVLAFFHLIGAFSEEDLK